MMPLGARCRDWDLFGSAHLSALPAFHSHGLKQPAGTVTVATHWGFVSYETQLILDAERRGAAGWRDA